MTGGEAASAISRLPVMELLASSSLRSMHDTLITVRDFVAGELLLELPLSAALTKDSAQALPIIRFLDAEDGRSPRGLPHWAALPDDFVLALQLMHLRSAAPPLACDDDSATHPWLAWLRKYQRKWERGGFRGARSVIRAAPLCALSMCYSLTTGSCLPRTGLQCQELEGEMSLQVQQRRSSRDAALSLQKMRMRRVPIGFSLRCL